MIRYIYDPRVIMRLKRSEASSPEEQWFYKCFKFKQCFSKENLLMNQGSKDSFIIHRRNGKSKLISQNKNKSL